MKKKLKKILPLIILLILTACGGETDIKKADDWKDTHPEVYATYLSNDEMESTTYGGSEPIDYLEKYPYLRVILRKR